MIHIVKADGKAENEFIAELRARSNDNGKSVTATVSEIIENVRLNGDKAVDEYTMKFDGQLPAEREITKEEIEKAIQQCDPDFISALKNAAEKIADFHKRQFSKAGLPLKKTALCSVSV